MKHEVVITGYGLVSPIGLNAEEFEKNLFAGASGVTNIRGSLVSNNFPVPYAAWIPREKLPPSQLYAGRETDILKSWLMTEQAARQALNGLRPEDSIDAIVFGTADGVSYEIVEEILAESLPANYDFNNVRSESSLFVLRDLVKKAGLGTVTDSNLLSLNSACATGNQTLGIALHGLRNGRWKRCLVGGVDARCEASNFLNFYLLGALTTDEVPPHKASRPFSSDRSGFVRGEGAAVLILETREAAEARGAPILGVASGYACTSDAYRLTDGREDGLSVVEAMRQAIADAGLSLGEIDYINAHGTSTPLNDRLETLSIKKLFGERAYQIPISSIKSQIGHSTIASSTFEAIACLMMLKRQMVSPTLNCDQQDADCDLDYVPDQSRSVPLKHVLSNSFGFGGQNTCAVFSKEGL